MDDDALTTALDIRTEGRREPVRRLEVFSNMAGRRRAWSLEQKLAIVAEAEHCDNLSALARRHDIRTSQLYTWRRELRYACQAQKKVQDAVPQFVPIVADAPVRTDIAIEIDIDGAVVRILAMANADLAAAVVKALRPVR